MRALALFLALLPARARAVQAVEPVAAVRAFAAWVGTPAGASAARSFDPRLEPLAALAGSADAAQAAAAPLAAQFSRLGADLPALARIAELPAPQQQALLRDAAVARALAAVSLRETIRTAELGLRRGKLSAEDAARRSKGWSALPAYGASVAAALEDFNRAIEETRSARLAPLLKDPFAPKTSGSALTSPDKTLTGSSFVSSSQPLARAAGARDSDGPAPPPAPKKRSNFATRAATAAFLVPGVLALVHLGGAPFVAFTTVLSGLMAFEYSRMLAKGGRSAQDLLLVAGALSVSLATALGFAAPALAAALVLAGVRETLRPSHSIERLAFTALGLALFGFLPAHLALLRAIPLWGERLTLLAVVATMAADTTAMAAGKAFGRRKLAPYLSPNKTWAGALGGFLATLGCAALFAWVWPGLLGPLGILGFALALGGLGQISGLMSSMLKRANGVKDSGTLLPGHGGFIDRFDGYILGAAAVYALARLLL